MSGEQLALNLGHRTALDHEDFLVAPSNADAVAWLDRWPGWPAPALALHGPAGCGKSHLAQVWRARSHAVLIAGHALVEDRVPEVIDGAGAVVVEDVDRGAHEEVLLHLYNALAERAGFLLLTGRTAPARWPLVLPDLRSRLKAIPAVAIEPPDDALLAAVMVKMFADRQLAVGVDVVSYLVAHIERSFEAARGVVAALDGAALARRRRVSVRLAREVLENPGL
jgi:chromosomal replication initiation ATPase DnaA